MGVTVGIYAIVSEMMLYRAYHHYPPVACSQSYGIDTGR